MSASDTAVRDGTLQTIVHERGSDGFSSADSSVTVFAGYRFNREWNHFTTSSSERDWTYLEYQSSLFTAPATEKTAR